MQTGAIISGWGHLIIIGLAALSGPIFDETKDNEILISEISVVSLSEFEVIQEKFEKNFDNSEVLISEKNKELDDEFFEEHGDKKDVDPLEENLDVMAQNAPRTSTPSVESPELPEIINSTPSGFDTNILVVGEEVALNLDVPDSKKLESPEENFDIKIDTKPYPEARQDTENTESASIINTPDLVKIDEKVIEDSAIPKQTITEPIIDALIAELSVAPMRSVRPKGRSLDDAIIQEDPAQQLVNSEVISSDSNEPVQSARNAPTGPKLTDKEKDNLRVAVGRCWNRNSLSREALEVTVTVLFNMSEAGYPEYKSIKKVDSFGGSAIAVENAYQAARRAIMICGREGFVLPEEKYAHWKTIEMVFDPIKLRME